METDVTNRADELLESLTHGPIPAVMDWEIIESGLGADNQAWAVLEANGRRFTVIVEEQI